MSDILIELAIFIGVIVLFFYIINKIKHRELVSKIIVLVIIIYNFWKIYTGEVTEAKSVWAGTIPLGLSWGIMVAVQASNFLQALYNLVVACVFGAFVSFLMAILEVFGIPLENSIRVVSLVGLGLSAISTIFCDGEFFLFDNIGIETGFEGTSNTTTIRARTIDWGYGSSETTYEDDKGNKVKIEHKRF